MRPDCWLLALALLCAVLAAAACTPEPNDGGGHDNDNDDDVVLDDDADDDSTDDDADDDVDDDIDDDVDDDLDDDSSDDDATDDDTSDDDSADDDTVGPIVCYRDEDWDDYGDPAIVQEFEMECPLGWSPDNTDCNDEDPLTHPGAPELPDDGVDQNCDELHLIHSDDNGVFVSKNGDDANPGAMAEPKLTIQAGIDLAQTTGKVVYVAEGVYQEAVSTVVSIFGGYDPADWSRDPSHEVTIVAPPDKSSPPAVYVYGARPLALGELNIHGGAGEGLTSGVAILFSVVEIVNCLVYGGAPVPSGNSSATYGVWGEDATTFVVNSTIRGGWVSGVEYALAVGMLMGGDCKTVVMNSAIFADTARASVEDGYSLAYGVSADGPLLVYQSTVDGGEATCMAENCTATTNGVVATGASLLKNNYIYAGEAESDVVAFATGVMAQGPSDLVDNIIDGGTSDLGLGETVAVFAAAPTTLVNNVLLGGWCNGDFCRANGIEDANTDYLTAVNNTISGGSALGYFGHTVGVQLGKATLLVNNIIDPGQAGYLATGLLNSVSVAAYVIDNDVWGAGPGTVCLVSGSMPCLVSLEELNACAWETCAQAEGNISNDPLFVDPTNGDYHLSDGSACIDTGIDPAPWYDGDLADFDFEGDPRPLGLGWDIGVDEFASE